MLHADTFTNLVVAGLDVVGSGPLIIGLQSSDTDVSGNYTDPTSGLAAFPGAFSSGGNLILCQSGLGTFGLFVSGQSAQSGFMVAQGFQRPGRYVRALMNSGLYVGPLSVDFIGNLHTTGSGAGFSFSPGSGVVNV